MEEHCIAEPEQTPTVLYASRPNSFNSRPNSSNSWPNNSSNYRGGGSWRNQRGGGRTNRRGGRGQSRYPMQHYGYNQFHNQSQPWRAPYTPRTSSSIHGPPPPPPPSSPSPYHAPTAHAYYVGQQDPTPRPSSTAYNYPPQQHVNCSNSLSNSGPLQPTNLATHLNTLTLQSSSEPQWFMDTGASSHMAPHSGNFHFIFNPSNDFPKHVIVGNGSTVPILKVGDTILTSTPFRLTNVYVTPHIIKNLVSVRKNH
ncbi:PREDICTED: heterogeneous nuclear ribonucleoprotein U-like protein 1 [Erythranthe guttata]|uniref:heterogeneous nuclear ribonucleoprotein U-like protein 1 n=1 Tax=Erythranthe guttata TaxID=4155 RepID=UPI00064D74CD|nr:PREDICTED: heterogeneous nuclear ribonucleoprotein U-like protein 1 [Erythranthe guttata]|eukprot:XP_012847853.1 PREDICTED: heterogeneous nuclear ribonucleoprotein U-like protein 1 [Erythranthe guttata]